MRSWVLHDHVWPVWRCRAVGEDGGCEVTEREVWGWGSTRRVMIRSGEGGLVGVDGMGVNPSCKRVCDV
jgi:hypothetical protein